MQKLISALEKTIDFLNNSEDSIMTDKSAFEVQEILEKEIKRLKENKNFSFFGKSKIKFLFLPTGALQEIAIVNGWGDEYLQIAAIVDEYIN